MCPFSGKTPLSSPLNGKIIAVPESRQLDILADLLQRRGAHVIRTPLISILDAPDPEPVERWLREFIERRPDYFVILTGEGLRRLCGFARRAGCFDQFRQALEAVTKICRGPKPAKALRDLDLKPDGSGKEPTTEGIIATLAELEVEGRDVAVQLYGEDPNRRLMDWLAAHGANGRPVAPYVYAPRQDDELVLSLIRQMAAGGVDFITFTSQPQLKRMRDVARNHQEEESLRQALEKTAVAAVGPVVAGELQAFGVKVAVMPTASWFMKPMVAEMERYLQTRVRE